MPNSHRHRSTHPGKDHLNLMAALKSGDLAAFIALAEAEGFGAADGQAFKRALTAVVKPKRSNRLVSRSQGCLGGEEAKAADQTG
jgi:hypothetical protein